MLKFMVKDLLDGRYTKEKSNLKKLLIGSRMIEVSYNETFNLLLRQSIFDEKDGEIQMVLTIDAQCWFGNKDEWLAKIETIRDSNSDGERMDCLLASELVRLRYNNLIQVEKVDFLKDYLTITFQGNNSLSIAYCAESEYAWLLEEVSPKTEQERMMMCCQGNELFQNNMPIYL